MKWLLYLITALIYAGIVGYYFARHKMGYQISGLSWFLHLFFLSYFVTKTILEIYFLINKK